MRALPFLIAAFVLAGCVNPLADEEPVDAAAIDDAGGEPSAETAAPEASPSPSSSSSAPPPSSSSSSGSSTASSSSSASGSAAPPPPPPPPVPVVWNLTSEARVGWAAAAGGGVSSPQPGQGVTDAEHCPDATFVVPAEALSLRVAVSASPAAGGSAGFYDIIVSSAGGEVAHLQPAMDVTNNAPGGEPVDHSTLTFEAPVAGNWTLHAEPMGPSVGQVWTVAIEAGGESITPPTEILVTPGCTES